MEGFAFQSSKKNEDKEISSKKVGDAKKEWKKTLETVLDGTEELRKHFLAQEFLFVYFYLPI